MRILEYLLHALNRMQYDNFDKLRFASVRHDICHLSYSSVIGA